MGPSNYTLVSRLRIAVGAWRKQSLARYRDWRLQPQIRRAARPSLAALRRIKKKLPPQTPLIGFLLTEHLGDVVACEPVISYVKSRNPRACLVWLTKPAYASLVESHPLIHAVVPLNSVSEADVIIKSGGLDQVFDLHLTGKPCGRFGRYHVKRTGNAELTTQNYFQFGTLLAALAQSAGLPALETGPRLYVGSETKNKIDALALPEHYVVIHATSNEVARNWNDGYWPQLVEKLREEFDLPVVEVGLKPVLPKNFPGTIDFCGKLSPIETAEVIARAELFIGVDSGPAQCANALQVPSVILLGRYRTFGHYMPYTGYFHENEREMLLRSETHASELSIDTVYSRAQSVLQARLRVSSSST